MDYTINNHITDLKFWMKRWMYVYDIVLIFENYRDDGSTLILKGDVEKRGGGGLKNPKLPRFFDVAPYEMNQVDKMV